MNDDSIIQVKTVFKDITIIVKYIIEEKEYTTQRNTNRAYYDYKVASVELKAIYNQGSNLFKFMLSLVKSLDACDESDSFKDLIFYHIYKVLDCAMKITLICDKEYQLLIVVISKSISYSFVSDCSRSNSFFLIKSAIRKLNTKSISSELADCIRNNLIPVCLDILSKNDLHLEMYIDANEVLQRVFELLGSKSIKNKFEMQFDSIVNSLCNVYLNSKSNYPADLLLSTMNAYLQNSKKCDESMTRQIFDIFYQVFNRLSLKIHYGCWQSIEIIECSECMHFFSIMCDKDISPVYFIRLKIIDFLSSSSIFKEENVCQHLNINLKYWSLKLIK